MDGQEAEGRVRSSFDNQLIVSFDRPTTLRTRTMLDLHDIDYDSEGGNEYG